MDVLDWLPCCYQAQRNGDWEHGFGPSIATIETASWNIKNLSISRNPRLFPKTLLKAEDRFPSHSAAANQMAKYPSRKIMLSIQKIRPFLVCCILISIAQGQALAASFDCSNAKLPRERLICKDKNLSDLDEKLEKIYQDRKSRLTKHGVEMLQSSERNWLHYSATVCPLSVSADAVRVDRRLDPATCMQTQYTNRLDQLSSVAQKIGPFVFSRVDLFEAEAAPENEHRTGIQPGFIIHHVAYPQIDSPVNQQTSEWNKSNVKRVIVDPDHCDSDDDEDYEITYATISVISVHFTDSEDCHEGAHPEYFTNAESVVLVPTLHKITAYDLFADDTGWMERLQALFRAAFWLSSKMPERGRGEAERRTRWSQVETGVWDNVKAIVINSDGWYFTKQGLTVSFSAYDGGCYACTPGPLTVKWQDLKPLLSRNSVVP